MDDQQWPDGQSIKSSAKILILFDSSFLHF